MGPWDIGVWYRPLAVVAVLGCGVLILIGMQPPNEIAVWIVGGTIVALGGLWFGYMRQHFPGPALAILDLLHERPANEPPPDPNSLVSSIIALAPPQTQKGTVGM
jgi:hypothetical protein